MKSFLFPRFLALLVVWASASSLTFAKINKAFIENIGQVTDQHQNKRADIIAKYHAGNGLNFFLSKTGIHYQWSKENEIYRMDVKLVAANANPRVTKEQATGYKEQYQHALIKGTAHSFEKITYHDIYPNIDWTFYFNEQGKLEHDFIIRAGGKVSDIRLQYAGADNVKIDRFGNLVATTSYGSISEPAPYSYELATNKKISSSYQLNGNTLSFKTSAYTGTMVIDPVIEWATYFGGSEFDEMRDVKIGKDGFVYAVGATNSTTNIATTGAHLTTFQGGNNSIGADAFITKFDTDGNCIWATYFGGTNVDLGLSLAVDTAGYLYMAGRTNSQTGIATIGSHQDAKAGTNAGYDVYLSKFDTSGVQLWGTYFGGTGADGLESVALTSDRYDNLYLAGNTQSAGIATTGAFQVTRPGNQDGFIAKFKTTGTLSWASYFGSSANDWINDITTDTAGNIIVVGQSQGTTGLSTAGAFQETGNGGSRDGFVAKFDSAGQRSWSTYYGGGDWDILYSLATGDDNSIYIAGVTSSINNIASIGAHQPNIGGLQDFSIAKFNPSGSLDWSTYYGGTENEVFPNIAIEHGKIFLTGETASPNNIATPNGIWPIYNMSFSEALLATFNLAGQRTWATYLGGDVTDRGIALAINDNEEVYLVGRTSSINNLTTTGAHQIVFGGLEDAMLMKINMCEIPETPGTISGNVEVCENSSQQYNVSPVNGADSYEWILPSGWTGSSNSNAINVVTGANGGELSVVAINSCGASDTISLSVTVNPAPLATISRSGNILSVSNTFTSYQWMLNSNPIAGATNPTHIVTENGIYTLEVEGTSGCLGLSNEIVVDNMTSKNDLSKLGVKMYPNPFHTELNILVPTELNISIVDIAGRTIKAFYLKKGSHVLDLSSLTNGFYTLNAYDPETSKHLGAVTIVKAGS